MTTDRQVKVLLALIAIALFLNALNPWLQPAPALAAQAPPADLPMMEVHLRNIDSYLRGQLGSTESALQAIQRDVERIRRAVCETSEAC